MSILQKLNALKNNVFGGPGNTGSTTPIGRKSAIELAKTNPLNGRLDDDPFAFTSMVYPQSMSDYKQEGQYIIFYINERIPKIDLKKTRDAKKAAYEAAADTRESYRGRMGKTIKKVLRPNIGDIAGPIYKDAKEAASRPNIGQITGGIASAAAAARPNIGDITGPAAALIDSAAATRPTIADISGGISDAAAAANQESFRGRVTGAVAAASTIPARPNIGDISGAAASAASNPIRNFNMGDITGGYTAPTAPARPNIGQITGGYATAPARPNQADIAGPLAEKLIVVNNPVRKPGKKQIFTDSEGTDLSLQKQQSTTGMNSYANLTTRINKSVALYLPPNIQSEYGVKYNATETGTFGFLAAKGGNFIQNIRDNELDSAAGNITSVMKDLTKALGLKTIDEISSILGTGEGAGALVQKFFGEATNPYMEVLFENVEMRQFTYSFNFTPKSQKETQEIKNIIETFRTHMAPEVINDNGRYMTLPSEFDIHYMYQDGEGEAKENTYYNKIATCVLTSCNVNYTPNGVVQVHADGSPVSINMQLSFQETEMITKQHIKKGF